MIGRPGLCADSNVVGRRSSKRSKLGLLKINICTTFGDFFYTKHGVGIVDGDGDWVIIGQYIAKKVSLKYDFLKSSMQSFSKLMAHHHTKLHIISKQHKMTKYTK